MLFYLLEISMLTLKFFCQSVKPAKDEKVINCLIAFGQEGFE